MNVSRLISIFLLAAACVPSLRAQTSGSAEAVTVRSNKVYCLQGNSSQVLTNNLKLPNDIEVATNGTFTVAGGNERKLAEGQVLRSDGWLLNPDGSAHPVFDRVAMENGHVIMVRDGGPFQQRR